jgi:membrane protease YdiL (CAAX protease family)
MSDPSSVAKDIFINREGELRSGWRILVFVILFVILLIFLGGLVLLARLIPSLAFLSFDPGILSLKSAHEIINAILNRALLLAAALAASAVCARLLEHRSLASVGYKLHQGWVRDYALGSIIGALSLAVAVAIAAAGRAAQFSPQATGPGAAIRAFVILFFLTLIAAAFEEVFLRGFVFQALIHNLGPVIALALTSVVFGLLHAVNPNATVFSTLNTMLAGVWLGAAYLMTRSLWLATALHQSWNLTLVFVFGLPVSGLNMSDGLSLLDGRTLPPDWLSGGSYGPEGGAAATLALVLSTLVIWKGGLFAPTQEMLAATRHPPTRPLLEPAAPHE